MSKYFPNFLIFCFCFLLFEDSNAQPQLNNTIPIISDHPSISEVAPIKFKRLGEAEGIPKYIGHVKKDKKGFIWMDTKEGIIRYDGIRTQVFKHDELDPNGLSSNFIRSVSIGQSNQIWAITIDFGLYKFDPYLEKFQKQPLIYEPKEETPTLAVTFLLEDSFGITWLATRNDGLQKLNPATGQLTKVDLKTHLPIADYTDLHGLMEDRDGNLWGLGKHLFRISFAADTRVIKEVKNYPELGDFKIRTVVEDRLGNIWAAGPAGKVYKFQAKDKPIRTINLSPTQEAITTGSYINELFVDNKGKIWVANNSSGINIIDPISGKVSTILNDPYNPFSLSINEVIGISGDEMNGVWISTWGGGINYYNTNIAKFGHFYSILNKDDFLSDNNVTAFQEAKNGSVWIGTQNGLNKFNRKAGQITAYLAPSSLEGDHKNDLLSILVDEALMPYFNGTILIGSKSGLMIFDPKSEKFSKWKPANETTKSLANNYVYGLRKDKKGVIWAYSYYPFQIFKFDTLSHSFHLFEPIYQKDTLKDVDNIVADFQGNYWLGTINKGLFKLDLTTETLSHFNIKSNTPFEFKANLIRCFWKDRQNRQWIGTELGLFLLKPAEQEKGTYYFQRFKEEDGLPGLAIHGIIEDEQGAIWLSTKKGVSKLNPNTMSFINYRQADGLQGNQFNYNATYRSPSSNKLYFGGTNGFNGFNPEKIEIDTSVPFVAITDVEVFRNAQMLRIIPEQNKDSEKTASISLFYGDKLLQIKYAALHFAAPTLNQYAVQLEGYDNGWRKVGNNSEVTYTNLNPGNYEFRVKAANKDGVWNEKGASLNIIVHPPWWATWWAYSIYALLSLGSLYALYRFQLNRKLEKAEAKQLKELNTLKSTMLKEIHHRVKNNLQIISNLMAKQARKTTDDTVKRMMQEGQDRVQSMALIHQNLYQSDSLSGIDVKAYLEELTQNIARTQAVVGKKIAIQLVVDDSKLDIDTAIPIGLILNELITNSFKYAFPDRDAGEISIGFKKMTNQKFSLVVKDNGIGIANDFNIRKAKSLGLNLVQGLVMQLDGSMKLNGSSKGTQFELFF